MKTKKRCSWCNEKNPAYVRYHDEEWGRKRMEEAYLFEMLLLEIFQAGLSWECVLNKREAFRKAFDGFDPKKIALYQEDKIGDLLSDPGIIRNRRKILAAVENARVFLKIQEEFGSFRAYLETFTQGKRFREIGKSSSPLSDRLSGDLKKRGARFAGSTVLYAYLQAIGVILSHEEGCFLHREE